MDARLRQSNMFPELALELSAQECLELLQSAPLHYRTIIERTWACAKHHYNTTRARFERDDLEALLKRRYDDGPRSKSAFDRAHARYRQILPWPIAYGQEPPWTFVPVENGPVVLKPEDQVRAGQLTLDEDGTVLFNGRPLKAADNGYIKIAERFVQLAAGLAALIALDGLDGRIDHVIHWCAILVHAMHSTIG